MASPGTCKVCSNRLVMQVDDESDDEMEAGPSHQGGASAAQEVPDDLELPCGCHFHWQCILDQSPHVALNLTCPSCNTPLVSNATAPSATNTVFHTSQEAPAILTQYTTESGTETEYDILPTLTEEAYLASHPEERRARAFLMMCAQGDIMGVVELLKDADEEADGGQQPGGGEAVIMYRDSLNGGKSGLHIAIEKGQEEVVWLLLYLGAPGLSSDVFPGLALETAGALDVKREDVRVSGDVRVLEDDEGRTAEDYASAIGGQWDAIVRAGVLRG